MPKRDSSRCFKFTPSKLAALAPTDKPVDYMDERMEGLRLRVPQARREAGGTVTKVFRWHYRAEDGHKVITIGPWSMSRQPGFITLQEAHEWLAKLKAAKVGGNLPAVETALRAFLAPLPSPVASPTDPKRVETVAEAFYRDDIQVNRKVPGDVRRILDTDIIPALGAKRIDEVTLQDCIALVKAVIRREAPSHAGKVLAIVKQLFSWAQSEGLTDKNPAEPLDAKKAERMGVHTNVRDRYLDDDEINLFWHALDAATKNKSRPEHRRLRPATSLALRLLLLTGARSGELLKAKWVEVNFDADESKWKKNQKEARPTWTVPVENQKLTKKQVKDGAKPFVIPLSGLAVELFKELRTIASAVAVDGKPSPWVMASSDSASGHYDEKALGHAVRRLFEGEPPALTLAGGEFTPHDLRRTARTHLGKLKVAPHVAELCLNHRLGKIMKTYDQHDYMDERRDALALWAAKVERVIAPDASNVVFMETSGA